MSPSEAMNYTYSGDSQYRPPVDIRDPQGREYFPYIPEPGLKKALNLAIALQRPLLLEGEPGCGKTRIASALAYELSCKNLWDGSSEPNKDQGWWNFYIWNITSTSRARDGLYTYDAVGRLRDAQLIGSDPSKLDSYLKADEIQKLRSRLSDKTRYRQFGALGEALRGQTYRPVMLIDEIDKADSDFPNDLLLELDELRFTIPETGENIPPPTAATKPIILITSNREKPLPEPFLRRCLYYYVTFPEPDTLRDIITARFGDRIADKKDIVNAALQRFDQVRNILDQKPGNRLPGTSELLEFLTALIQDDSPIENAIAELEALGNNLPLLGTLIKTQAGQALVSPQLKERDG